MTCSPPGKHFSLLPVLGLSLVAGRSIVSSQPPQPVCVEHLEQYYIKTGGDSSVLTGFLTATDPISKCCRAKPSVCHWFRSQDACVTALDAESNRVDGGSMCLGCRSCDAYNVGCPSWSNASECPPPPPPLPPLWAPGSPGQPGDHCPDGRPNRVQYALTARGQGRPAYHAGLGDRVAVIRDLADLAFRLCALVVLAPPSTMLSAQHNHGAPVSQEKTWDDYVEVRFAGWNGSALTGPGSRLQLDSGDVHLSNSVNNAIRHFGSRSSVPFVLRLEDNLDDELFDQLWRRRTAGDVAARTAANPHVSVGHSSSITAAADDFLRAQGLEGTEYTSIHLRRGDAVRECNTSLGRVEDALRGCRNLYPAIKDLPTVLFTDETDEGYLAAVLSTASAQEGAPKSSRTLITADAWFSERLDDNFAVFAAGQVVKDRAVAGLTMRRRQHCGRCWMRTQHGVEQAMLRLG